MRPHQFDSLAEVIVTMLLGAAMLTGVCVCESRSKRECEAQTCSAPTKPRYDSRAGLCRCEVLPTTGGKP